MRPRMFRPVCFFPGPRTIHPLKGPKHEIFESGFFTQIRGLWLGELGTGEKNLNFESWSHYSKVFAAKFLLSVRSACA